MDHRRLTVDAVYSFVPRAAVSPDVEGMPAVTVEQLDRLRGELARAGRPVASWRARTRDAASLLRGGERLYWGFQTVWDALACVRHAADPRCPLVSGAPVDIVRLDAEPLLTDGRFVRPEAASLISEVPHLAPAQERRWLENALYAGPQVVFRPAAVPAPGATARIPADELLRRLVSGAVRRAATASERQRIRMLPTDLSSWLPGELARWADCHELYAAGHHLFAPPRKRKR